MKLPSFIDALAHFRTRWPNEARNVADAYKAVSAHKFFLADVLLRGGVMSVPPPGLSDRDGAIFEGRRQLAVEIIRLAGEDPARLYAIIEKTEIKPEPQRS